MPNRAEQNIVSVKMPSDMVTELDILVRNGDFENRSHAVRTFVKSGLKNEEVSCNA